MSKILYSIVLILEMSLGMWVFIREYPELRFKKTIVKIIAVFLYAALCYLRIWNGLFIFLNNLEFVFGGIWNAFFLFVFFNCKFINALIWEWFFSLNIIFLRILFLVGNGVLFGENLDANVGAGKSYGEMLYCLFIWLLVFCLCLKFKTNFSFLIKELISNNKRAIFLLLVVEWIILTRLMGLSGETNYQTKDFFISLIIIICMISINVLFYLVFVYQKSKYENILMAIRQDMLSEQQIQLEELYKESNRKMHDIKHIMGYLHNCLEKGQYEQAQEYVEQYAMTLKTDKVWTGFSFIDFVLNSKKDIIDQTGIQLSLTIDMQYTAMSETDFAIVLANLLENAIEAAKDCREDNREIKLSISTINDILLMNLRNTIYRKPKMEKGQFVTSKSDKNIHGWGIENVKQIVQKYDGDIQFQFDAEYFQVTVSIFGKGV